MHSYTKGCTLVQVVHLYSYSCCSFAQVKLAALLLILIICTTAAWSVLSVCPNVQFILIQQFHNLFYQTGGFSLDLRVSLCHNLMHVIAFMHLYTVMFTAILASLLLLFAFAK